MAWTMNHPPRMPSTVGERSAKHYDRINTDPGLCREVAENPRSTDGRSAGAGRQAKGTQDEPLNLARRARAGRLPCVEAFSSPA